VTQLTPRTATGEALTLADAWARLTDDERKRRAAVAANTRDADALGDLTIAHLTTHGRASESTRRNYRHAVRRLVAAWEADGVNLLRPPRDAGHMYARHLEAEHAAATVRVHLAGCAALYRALRAAGATEAHPFGDVKVAKADERRADERRDAFAEAEVAAMLRHAEPVDAVLVLLGARGGLRLAEVLALRWADVLEGATEPHLIVRMGKGGRTRRVDLAPQLAAAIAAWRLEAGAGDRVMPYTSQTRARQRLRRLQERAGVRVEAGRAAHSLRHTAGTTIYQAAGDLVAVQEHLGHASVATSRGYVHRASRAKLREVLAALPTL
jgi:integrase/recombinase XerC